MSDVVDVIHRLSYEISGESSLTGIIDNFKKQADAIDKTKAKLAEMKQYVTQNAAEEKNLQQAINATTASIEKRTAALQNSFNNNKQVQQAIVEDMSLIASLNRVIKENQDLRFGVTIDDPNGVAKIKSYTESIKAAQAELKSLIAPNADFKAPVGAIQGLQNKQTLLQNAIASAPANPEYIATLNKELDATKVKIKELQNAGKEPIINPIRNTGAIEALQNRITILKNTIKTVPAENIPIINQELAKTEAQLLSLQNLGKSEQQAGGGILSGLFGGGSTARQILTGSLIGIGFGSGLGLITRAVSGLIEYAATELDATKKAEQLAKANEALIGSFDKMAESIAKLNEQERILNENEIKNRLGIDLSADGYKAQEEAIRALGQAKNESYIAETALFNKAQERRQIERADLATNVKTAKEEEKALKSAADAASKADADEFNGDHPFNFQDIERTRARAAKDAINKSVAINNDQKAATGSALDEAVSGNGNVLSALDQAVKNSTQRRIAAENELAKKDDEFKNEEIKRTRKHDNEIYNLDVKLKQDLKTNEIKFQEDKAKSQLKNATDTINEQPFKSIDQIDNIAELQKAEAIRKNELEKQDQLDKIRDERTAERKKLHLAENAPIPIFTDKDGGVHDPEADYSGRITQVVTSEASKQADALHEIELKRLNDRKEFIKGMIAENDKLSLSILSSGAEQSKNKADNGLPDRELISAATDNQYILEVEAAKQHNIELLVLYKDNQDQITIIQKQYKEQQLEIEQKYYRAQLSEAEQYFSKLSKDIKDAATLQLTQTETNIISGGNGLFGKQERLDKADATSKLNTDEKLQSGIQQVVNSDTQALDEAQKANPNSDTPSQAEIDATKQLNAAKQKQADIEKDAAVQNEKLHQIKLQNTMKEVDAIQSVAEATVKSYDVISEARQKDLDREISVRTQRVDLAYKLAERGNTQALAQEQKALDAAQEQKRKAALQEQEINAALTVSNAILGVAKAAASGAGAIVLIPAIIGLLATGFAEANALSASQKQSFAKGVVNLQGAGTETSDSIPTNLSKGESVVTAAATRKHGAYLEMINKGIDPFPTVKPMQYHSSDTGQFASKSDLNRLEAGLNNVVDAINGKTVDVRQSVDKSGVHQMVMEQQKASRLLWKS